MYSNFKEKAIGAWTPPVTPLGSVRDQDFAPEMQTHSLERFSGSAIGMHRSSIGSCGADRYEAGVMPAAQSM